jgi:acetylornithine/succinyldiaminopimelate/putrescine aminotransferase
MVVLETVTKDGFMKEITRKGQKFLDTIAAWNHPKITAIRGKGMMLGVDLTVESWPVLEALISKAGTAAQIADAGLLLLGAGKQTLRFLPPYTISDSEIEQGLEILKSVL